MAISATLPALPSDLPGPGRLRLLPTLRRLGKDPLDFLDELSRHGDLATFRLAHLRLCLLNSSELVEEVFVHQAQNLIKGKVLERAQTVLGKGLLTNEGRDHQQKRRLVQPAFHRQRLATYAAAMAESSGATSAGLCSGREVQVDHLMQELTLEIVCKTIFAADLSLGDREIVSAALGSFQDAFDRLLLPMPPSWFKWVPTARARLFRHNLARLDALIARLIQERRQGADRGDVLSMLLAARDENGDALDSRQVRDEVLTLLLAGHETTAQALTFALWALAGHAEVRERLEQEVDRVLGHRPVTAEDLGNLGYTRQVFAEAMRLYPPAWAMGRRSIAEVELRGQIFPAGTIFFASQYLLHRRSDIFPQPEKFDPERFSPGWQERLPKFAYIPFGAGPRLCIGLQFAWMEGTIVLATLAQRWRVRKLKREQKLVLAPRFTLRAQNGLRLIFDERKRDLEGARR